MNKNKGLGIEERKKMLTILEILHSIDPAPMHFSNFFTKDELESEQESGMISLMLSMKVIMPSESDPFSFRITPTGIEFIALPKTEQGRLVVDLFLDPDKVMISVESSTWAQKEETLWTLAINGPEASIPLLALGLDYSDKFEFFPSTKTNKGFMAKLYELAVKNLRKIDVEIFQEEGSDLMVIQGPRFASEKMFDKTFVQKLHARINSNILITSIPNKGCFFAIKSENDEHHLQRFKLVTETQFNDAGDSAFSKSLFVIVDGEVRGIIE